MSIIIQPSFFKNDQGIYNYRQNDDDERRFIIKTLQDQLGPHVKFDELENGLFCVAIQYMEDIHTVRMVMESYPGNTAAADIYMTFKIVEVFYNETLRADDAANQERYRLYMERKRLPMKQE